MDITNLWPLRADMHLHVLPGIDDGPQNVEQSVEMVMALQSLGYTQAIATPHIFGDMFRNNRTTIHAALHQLQGTLHETQIDFPVSAAAEYQLDGYFMGLMRSKEPLLPISGNYLLTEFGFGAPPQNLKEIVFAIITEGYKPVLAHPERYTYLHKDFDWYEKLLDLGFLFQLNLPSLAGLYGKRCEHVALHLLKQGSIGFVGSDAHNVPHIKILAAHRETITKALGSKTFLNDSLMPVSAN